MRKSDSSAKRLRNIDLNLLKVFNAIFSEKNISQAAAMLCVSQPAVSNALRRLREIYDDPLFVRTSNGMVPTPKAIELSVPLGNSLKSIDNTLIVKDLFQPSTSQRIFTLSLTDYGEFFFLPKIIRRLEKEAPGIEIACLPDFGSSLTLEMKSGSVDIVWDWLPVNDPDYFIEQIFEDKGCCLVRKDHPIIKGELNLKMFLEAEHVALLPTRSRNPRIERALEKKGLARKVVAEVSHLVVMPQIVATTNLIATMPSRLANFYGEKMGLQVLPNPIYQDTVPVYQMWHRHFEDDDGHKWLRNLMKDVVLNT